MDTTKEQKKIRALAENTKYYNELLIEQCDSWLSVEEGLKNLEERKNKETSHKKSKKKWGFFILFLFFVTWQGHAQTDDRQQMESYRAQIDSALQERNAANAAFLYGQVVALCRVNRCLSMNWLKTSSIMDCGQHTPEIIRHPLRH